MSLIQTMKAAQLQARKDRNTTDASLLSTLVGDVMMVGKNDGNRESTDAEAIAVVKKFLKNIDETLKVVKDSLVIGVALHERQVLEGFLPKQFTDVELNFVIEDAISTNNFTSIKDMGKLMKVLKEKFGGMYDGAVANSIAKTKLV